jgi:hypothetical protein
MRAKEFAGQQFEAVTLGVAMAAALHCPQLPREHNYYFLTATSIGASGSVLAGSCNL